MRWLFLNERPGCLGTFYVNHQVRGDTAEPVLALARRVCVGLAYVAPARNGWVAVYDESSDTQDEAMIHQVGHDLSDGLATTVFTFLVHDDDVFRYVLYERGKLVASFDSWPDYYRLGEQSPDADSQEVVLPPQIDQPAVAEGAQPQHLPESGGPEAILGHCVRGTTLQVVRDLLQQDSWALIEAAQRESREDRVDAVDRHASMARLLGIDADLAHMGFRQLEKRLDSEGLKGLRGVGKVRGTGRRRKLQSVAKARSIAEAVEAGDVEAVKLFLAEGADPHSLGSHGRSLLWLAAIGGHFAVALALLAANVRPEDIEADYLLAGAVRLGRPEVVPALVAAGVPINDQALIVAVMPESSDRPTRAHIDALKTLIEAGANVNGKDGEGMTPLTKAVEQGPREFVEVLLRAGADINAYGQNRRTALICGVVREARSPSRGFVRLLLDSGADPNVADDTGSTPLMWAARHPVDDMKSAKLVSEILRVGADVNAQDRWGQTALSLAIRLRHPAAAELLRVAGAR
jgi:ankyrin repeat protein